MSLSVRVEGGTNAGKRRPLKERPAPWQCICDGDDGFKVNPGFLVRCGGCGARRPT